MVLLVRVMVHCHSTYKEMFGAITCPLEQLAAGKPTFCPSAPIVGGLNCSACALTYRAGSAGTSSDAYQHACTRGIGLTGHPTPVPILPASAPAYPAFLLAILDCATCGTQLTSCGFGDALVIGPPCLSLGAGSEIYARPEVFGELPALPTMLQAIPWVERRSGDMVKLKEPWAEVRWDVHMKVLLSCGAQADDWFF